ncbi:hypothetical protein JZ751_004420, partial [Albula glossodonta]
MQPNTTYTCQINTTRVEDRRSIHIYGAFEEQARFPPKLGYFLMALSVVLTFIIIALSVSLYVKALEMLSQNHQLRRAFSLAKAKWQSHTQQASESYGSKMENCQLHWVKNAPDEGRATHQCSSCEWKDL